MYSDEQSFRTGACHAALWLSTIAKHMVCDGWCESAVVTRLAEMNEVLIEWHNSKVEMPEGPPWHWDEEQLDHFVSMRKSDW